MRILNDNEKKIIVDMYLSGKTQSSIAKTIHCREKTITDFLRNNGYERRKRNEIEGAENLSKFRKHHFNQSYFENIDTEEKAYWLGFLFADGNVFVPGYDDGLSKGGTVELSLKASDYSHIKKFLDSVNADVDYPIELKHVSLNGNVFDAYRIQLNSIKMCKDLIRHGCVPNKSLILKRPFISDDLIQHFIRGYFDGDGSVSYNPYSHASICSILGTQDILNFISDNIEICNNSIFCDKRSGKVYCLQISSISDLVIFYRYLYSNANIYLNRKKEKFDQFYQYCLVAKSDILNNALSSDPLIKYKRRGIPVVRISKDYSDIVIYKNISEAYCDLFPDRIGYRSNTITRCCRHLQKKAYGYYWLFYSEYIKHKDNIENLLNNYIKEKKE